MFESTRLYCRALPLASSGGVIHDGKYDILLFAAKQDYIKVGGPAMSSGVFIGGKNIVMVPLESLRVKNMVMDGEGDAARLKEFLKELR